MSTTAVVAEIVIVGLEAEAWFALLVVTIFGRGWVDLTTASNFVPILLVLMLAAAYALGIIIDRVADTAFRRFNRSRVGLWNNRRFGMGSEGWVLPERERAMRTTVMNAGGGMATFLDYQRSRIRVARGTALNAFIGAIIAGVNFGLDESWGELVGIETLLLGLLLVTVPVAERIRAAWLRQLVDAYRKLVPDVSEQVEDRIVAAVPYARTNEGPRFLIVRTKGGDRWTFPKGHVKEGESDRNAALRELKEEAGVEGHAEPEAFTEYRYPPTRSGARGDSLVRAFLVEIVADALPKPTEPGREPQWLPPEGAAAKLAEHREQESAAEHRRVLDEALSRIN